MASPMSLCSSTNVNSKSKGPFSANRPRLLSDILEVPISESAIPEEYSMRRAATCPDPHSTNPYHVQLNGNGERPVAPYQEAISYNRHNTAQAMGPGVIGQPPRRAWKLQTPTTPQASNRDSEYLSIERRKSTPSLQPIFTTSSAVSESGSPSNSPLAPLQRSFSQTSLSPHPTPSGPRTPAPYSSGSKGRGRLFLRSSSLPSSPKSRRVTPHPHGKPSVKHLTCFWWKVKGDCRFSEEDCLYAHRDTGLLADAPRQVTPGEPAKAGRHLEKALEDLRIKRNSSSTSLNTATVSNSNPPVVNTETPQERIASLQTENEFLRNLVEQSSKEKTVLVSTIEGLQKENSNLNQDVDFLKDIVDPLRQQQQKYHLSKGMLSPIISSREAK